MNEQDFDKLFGSQLPDLADKNWDKLQYKLQNFNLERRLSRLIWALWGLGLFSSLMLVAIGMMYYKMTQNQKNLTTLERRLIITYQKNYLKQDTIHQKIVVYDTINHHIQIVKGLTLNPNTLTQNQENNNIYYQKNEKLFNQESIVSERDKYIGLQTISPKKTIFNTFKSVLKNIVNIDSLLEDTVTNVSKFSLIPSSVTVGLIGGGHQSDDEVLKGGDGIHLGFRTTLGYNNRNGRERWGIILDFQKNDLNLNRKEAEEGVVEIPSSLPQNSVAHVKGAVVKDYSFYQFGLGLRYNLLFNNRIKPYLGISWATQIPNYYIIDYLIEESVGKQEIHQLRTYDSNLPTILNVWGVNVGINYQISPRLSAGLEVSYQSQFVQSLTAPNLLGTQVGINYRFK